MKQHIDWHTSNLANRTINIWDKERRLASLKEEIERDRKEADHLANQIIEAKRRGLDEFDNERFLKAKKEVKE
jgi:hypothetical protein